MKLNRFVEDRHERWGLLEGLIKAAGKRPERLAVADIRRLAAGYRSAAADLAIARQYFPGDPVTARLERITVAARALVYDRQSRRQSLLAFLANGYWRLLWERRRPIGLAAILLFAPALAGGLWGVGVPEAAVNVVPEGFLWVTEAQSTDQGMDVVGLAGFSTYVMVNNIRVTLMAFALGITFGLGTAYIVLNNGLTLGVIAGLAIGAGNGGVLVAAIAAHGILEFSCILVGAGAGLSLGRAMLKPGKKTRREALTAEAAQAFRIAGGTAPWLVLAGLIEGYVSRVGLGPVPTTLVGLGIGAIFWGLVWRRGRLIVGLPLVASQPVSHPAIP